MSKGNLRIVRGDGEIVSVNKNLYEILEKLPKPLSKFSLTKDQEYWWNFFGQQLVDSKKMTKPDLIQLSRLSKSVDYYLQAENEIAKNGYDGGLIQTFKGGATNVSGHVTVREKMLKEIDELSKHFGFSFKDRIKLKDEKQDDSSQGNLFEQFMKANHG